MFSQYSIFKTKKAHDKHPQPIEVEIKELYYIHPKIDLKHLFPNGKLINDAGIRYVKARFANHPDLTHFYLPIKFQPVDTLSMVNEYIDGKMKLVKRGYSVIKYVNPQTNQARFFVLYRGAKFKKALGFGNFQVKLMQELDSGDLFAVKIYKYNPDVVTMSEQRIHTEFEIMQALDEAVCICVTHANDGGKKYLLGMKLKHGKSLDKFCGSNPRLSSITWLQIVVNILKAAMALYEKGKLHRDYKQSNFMYDPVTGEIAIIDYEFAVDITDRDSKTYIEDAAVGTMGFIAPEIFNKGEYSQKSEVYALGKTIAGILDMLQSRDRHLPLYELSDEEIKNNNKITDKILCHKALHFLHSMTAEQPDKRPTMKESLSYFEHLQLESANIMGGVRKVMILDLNEYQQANTELREHFHSLLTFANEVWFLGIESTEDEVKSKCNDLLGELMDNDIIVGNKAFSAKQPGVNVLDLVKAIPSALSHETPSQPRTLFFASHQYDTASEEIPTIHVGPNQNDYDYRDAIYKHVKKQHLMHDQCQLVKLFIENKIKKIKDKHDAANPAVHARLKLLDGILHKLKHAESKHKVTSAFLDKLLDKLADKVLSAEEVRLIMQKQEHHYDMHRFAKV